ncbi:hypothetical protein KIN20_014098 [Parelaphostrongylus tenuis]|uniref:Uncharacterized protein n=1 Tax=Parelaphostrongylus tenuis TaxID=148309 RepID=A0AAD5MVG6_PARTN|nr:hypothetical protein KIN20_014098 [Parelaphostrongylus tenuis]
MVTGFLCLTTGADAQNHALLFMVVPMLTRTITQVTSLRSHSHETLFSSAIEHVKRLASSLLNQSNGSITCPSCLH